jgi:hypothetical protein
VELFTLLVAITTEYLLATAILSFLVEQLPRTFLPFQVQVARVATEVAVAVARVDTFIHLAHL